MGELLSLADDLAFRALQERGFLTIGKHISRERARSLVIQGVAIYDISNRIAESFSVPRDLLGKRRAP